MQKALEVIGQIYTADNPEHSQYELSFLSPVARFEFPGGESVVATVSKRHQASKVDPDEFLGEARSTEVPTLAGLLLKHTSFEKGDVVMVTSVESKSGQGRRASVLHVLDANDFVTRSGIVAAFGGIVNGILGVVFVTGEQDSIKRDPRGFDVVDGASWRSLARNREELKVNNSTAFAIARISLDDLNKFARDPDRYPILYFAR